MKMYYIDCLYDRRSSQFIPLREYFSFNIKKNGIMGKQGHWRGYSFCFKTTKGPLFLRLFSTEILSIFVLLSEHLRWKS